MKKPPATQTNVLDLALLGCILVGLGFSALLYGEYTSGSGMVCSVGGGCDVVRQSGYSSIAGISLPVIGVAYFVMLLGMAVVPGARFALFPLAGLGAGGALGLVAIQGAVIGAFCSLCLVVDVAAMGAGALAYMTREQSEPAVTGGRLGVVGVLALAAIVVGAGLPQMSPASTASLEAPPEVTENSDLSGGSVRVFEFIDFECPACRYQHGVFAQLAEELDYEIELVYFHAPLSQHANAEDAARAYLCAVEAGPEEGKRMADGLFTAAAPTAAVAAQLADEIGLDAGRFAACLTSSRVDELLAKDRDRANAITLRSLPTFWIGQQRFEGTVEPDVVRRNLDRARRGAPPS